jgi:hypothetical protein
MPDPLEPLYRQHLTHTRRAMTPHLPRLRALAADVDVTLCVEFGVKQGASSVALLMGAQHVISYDIVETPQARSLQAIAGPRWDYRVQDSRVAVPTPCDLCFVDSLHTYAQVKAELAQHAAYVRKYLVFHDTITFGSIGANGESGTWIWRQEPGVAVDLAHMGIRPAIDELMIADRSWRIAAHYTNSHGLLVLERAR